MGTGTLLFVEGCDGETSSSAGSGGSGGKGSSSASATSSSGGKDADAGDGGMQTVTLHPNAAPLPGESECKVEITTGIPTMPITHFPVCTPVTYSTDPPTWGDHWLIWAAYKKYTKPLPRQMRVHSQEHGGVVLSYRCSGECPDVVSMLDKVMSQVPDDELCFKTPGASKNRVLLTPAPDATAPIVASAWNAFYKATCIDSESLQKFVADEYGHGPERICDPGIDLEDPSQGFLDCGDAGGG